MTNEQMIEIAEQHFDYQGGWIANTEDLLKFARKIYQNGYDDAAVENAEPSWLG